ncbi:hypothetical protein BDV18DRAFT_13526 [Aspergillus unguis]
MVSFTAGRMGVSLLEVCDFCFILIIQLLMHLFPSCLLSPSVLWLCWFLGLSAFLINQSATQSCVLSTVTSAMQDIFLVLGIVECTDNALVRGVLRAFITYFIATSLNLPGRPSSQVFKP